MSLIRTNLIGWALGDTFTAAQANAIDLNVINALDKRPGQTDSLGSRVQCSGAGRVIPSVYVGTNSNTDIVVSDGRSIVLVTDAVASQCTYTLKNANAVVGDIVVFFAGSTSVYGSVVVQNDAGETLGVVAGSSLSSMPVSRLECLFDGTKWISAANIENVIFGMSSAGAESWTVPASGLYLIDLFGGGGGGGGGRPGTDITDRWTSGGGGGGGALRTYDFVHLSKGDSCVVVCGAGGAGGLMGGSNGGDSYVERGGVVLLKGFGASGGSHRDSTVTSNTSLAFANGGVPVRSTSENRAGWGGFFTNIDASAAPIQGSSFRGAFDGSSGGDGLVNNSACTASSLNTRGRGNATNTNGGNGGTSGSHASTYRGGGPGGGGGAGPLALESGRSLGGNGGAASSGSTGSDGTDGSDGIYGSGGGGGGGGGCGPSGGGTGGTGGQGGDGQVFVIRIR